MSTKLNVKLITDNLADELISRMQHASGIHIMTSFIMQSGVKLLAPYLKRAAERGAEVRMLAGDYLYITQPEGLRALCEVNPRIETHLWRSMGDFFSLESLSVRCRLYKNHNRLIQKAQKFLITKLIEITHISTIRRIGFCNTSQNLIITYHELLQTTLPFTH